MILFMLVNVPHARMYRAVLHYTLCILQCNILCVYYTVIQVMMCIIYMS